MLRSTCATPRAHQTKSETIDERIHRDRAVHLRSAGRLWQVFVNGAPTPARTYGYDANGNRDDGTYDAQDRLLTHGHDHAYGPNGELTKRTDDATGAETLYGYDAHGNLRSVTRPAPLAPIEYVIDGRNRRVAKKVGGVLVRGYVWSGSRIIAELDGAGAVRAEFVYAGSGHSPDLMRTAAGTHRFVKDHLGSPRLVVDGATGATVQRMDFDEWGEVVGDTNEGFQPLGFAGGIWDRDVGVVRFGARDYAPTTGRWTSKDQSRFGGGLNFYVYAAMIRST